MRFDRHLWPHPLFFCIPLIAALGCSSREPETTAESGSSLRNPFEGMCMSAMEPIGTACRIKLPEDPTNPGMNQGPTACPRSEALFSPRAFTGNEILKVRSSSVFQTHAAMIFINFGEAKEWCGSGVATVRYRAKGPGTYLVLEDESLLDQRPFSAVVERCGERGRGLLKITGDTGLDVPLTKGAIDVIFPDGARLLADFAAPLCMTE